jgi:hypothetical protein
VTVLACVGYGAFFWSREWMFRSFFGGVILIWEAINRSCRAPGSSASSLPQNCAVDIPNDSGTSPVLGLLISNSDPVSAPVAVLGILIVALIALYASSIQVRRMEINYTSE